MTKLATYIHDEKKVIISFSRMRLCNWNENAPNHYKNAINEIELIVNSASFKQSLPITLDFEGNFLDDAGITNIVKFIKDNDIVQSNLRLIDFSNNRFTKESLDHINGLLKDCKNLRRLDISINYLSYDDVCEKIDEEFFPGKLKYSSV